MFTVEHGREDKKYMFSQFITQLYAHYKISPKFLQREFNKRLVYSIILLEFGFANSLIRNRKGCYMFSSLTVMRKNVSVSILGFSNPLVAQR